MKTLLYHGSFESSNLNILEIVEINLIQNQKSSLLFYLHDNNRKIQFHLKKVLVFTVLPFEDSFVLHFVLLGFLTCFTVFLFCFPHSKLTDKSQDFDNFIVLQQTYLCYKLNMSNLM